MICYKAARDSAQRWRKPFEKFIKLAIVNLTIFWQLLLLAIMCQNQSNNSTQAVKLVSSRSMNHVPKEPKTSTEILQEQKQNWMKKPKRNVSQYIQENTWAHKKVHCITMSFALNWMLITIEGKEVFELAWAYMYASSRNSNDKKINIHEIFELELIFVSWVFVASLYLETTRWLHQRRFQWQLCGATSCNI